MVFRSCLWLLHPRGVKPSMEGLREVAGIRFGWQGGHSRCHQQRTCMSCPALLAPER